MQVRSIQIGEVCDKSKNGQNRDARGHELSTKEKYDTQEDMVSIFAEDFTSYPTVKKLSANSSGEGTENDSRSGLPKTSTTDEQVDAIHLMILDDR